MKTLALRDGDLVVGPGGYALLSGPSMVAQDLRCALLEPLGNDRFHPGFGSQAEDFIGLTDSLDAQFEVQQEVARVVQNYVAVQRDRIERDALRGVKSRYKTNEVVAEVEGIQVRQVGDTLYVKIRLRTISNESVDLITAVNL